MKKLILILAMACAALVSCNKENQEISLTPEQLLEKVQGKWACIHYELYQNQSDWENGISIEDFEKDYEPGGDHTQGLIIENGIVKNAKFSDGRLVLSEERFEILENDGKRLVTSEVLSGDGMAHFTIDLVEGDQLRALRRNSENKSIGLYIFVRTDADVSRP